MFARMGGLVTWVLGVVLVMFVVYGNIVWYVGFVVSFWWFNSVG